MSTVTHFKFDVHATLEQAILEGQGQGEKSLMVMRCDTQIGTLKMTDVLRSLVPRVPPRSAVGPTIEVAR